MEHPPDWESGAYMLKLMYSMNLIYTQLNLVSRIEELEIDIDI